MADYPLSDLKGKTPLEVAHTPFLDWITENGAMGITSTIPHGYEPGSDIANLSILGYDPARYYTGRGPLEALGRGIEVAENSVIFRCNLVYVENGIMKDYSAGHISSKEAKRALKELSEFLDENVRLIPGVSYRNLLVVHGKFGDIITYPPHDIVGRSITEHFPQGDPELGEILTTLMKKSIEILPEITNKANMIWPWGGGKPAHLPPFSKKYGVSGGMISAVDLLRGIGRAAGMEVIEVPGVTGYIDTNYEGKAKYAIEALERMDFVYVHVEGIDEASHEGDLDKKIQAIEDFDKRFLSILLDEMDQERTRVLVMPDHATPLKVQTHTSDPVPFALYGKEKDSTKSFSEKNGKTGAFGHINALKLMDLLIQ
jgi:2,3-bisphosphoglycerate-independent phosphoglycerate mutase